MIRDRKICPISVFSRGISFFRVLFSAKTAIIISVVVKFRNPRGRTAPQSNAGRSAEVAAW